MIRLLLSQRGILLFVTRARILNPAVSRRIVSGTVRPEAAQEFRDFCARAGENQRRGR
jgi:hypothetical protein